MKKPQTVKEAINQTQTLYLQKTREKLPCSFVIYKFSIIYT